ncbi:MAG: nickel-dependent hydrogenase large subunit [Gammaproteobacteria bacterium]|nr:nickel-dependent hydrogenase large subunit [Gammaproteobacteria bacterium]MCB1862623.1 nickel-dependent hydrogenase large subunit [Gammaproteobacteria bacterium]
MSRRILGPFNRVEGDLEVKLEIRDDRVSEAWVTSPMYRGFEQMLHGRDPRDALVYTPRVCGICSVSQSVAAANALRAIQGVVRPPNGELAINLIHGCENLADHFTHFYLFFMPDFAREAYRQRSWYDEVAARFKAVRGSAASQTMSARAGFMHIMGLLAGKWPHSLAIQPGGSTRGVEIHEKMRLLAILAGFRNFLEQQLFGDSLERMLELESGRQLQAWFAEQAPGQSDFRRFLQLALDLKLEELGRTDLRLMSYGVYPGSGGELFRRGTWCAGNGAPLRPEDISEDISHSWMEGQAEPQHPYKGVTLPDADPASGYTWCKAPRLAGEAVEVGAVARQTVDGQPLIRELVAATGSNVRNRVIARLIEIPRILLAMEAWCRELRPKEPFCITQELPDQAQGAGMTEAARGSLGHWVRVKNGRIINYQIVAPTTWNFSPRDWTEQPGPLEQALIGTPAGADESEPVAVQHVVRSFDPCMVCTVH